MHALAGVSILICGLGWPLKLVAWGLVLAHAALRPPPAPAPLLRNADGSWSLPALGLNELALAPGSAVGPFWARLRLRGGNGRDVAVLLLADQLDTEAWRTLQAELRRRRHAGTDQARHGDRFNLE